MSEINYLVTWLYIPEERIINLQHDEIRMYITSWYSNELIPTRCSNKPLINCCIWLVLIHLNVWRCTDLQTLKKIHHDNVKKKSYMREAWWDFKSWKEIRNVVKFQCCWLNFGCVSLPLLFSAIQWLDRMAGTVPLLVVYSAVTGSNVGPGTTCPDLTSIVLFSHSG